MFFFVEEVELKNFKFWAGAVAVAERINELDNADECWNFLEQYFAYEGNDNEPPTATEVNDMVWFDALDILTEAGYFEE